MLPYPILDRCPWCSATVQYTTLNFCPSCSASFQYTMLDTTPLTYASPFTPQWSNINFGYEWAAPVITTSEGPWHTTADAGTLLPSSALYRDQDLSPQDHYHSFDIMSPHYILYPLSHAGSKSPALPPTDTCQSHVSSLAHALKPQHPQARQAPLLCMPAGVDGLDPSGNPEPSPNANPNQKTSTVLNVVSAPVGPCSTPLEQVPHLLFSAPAQSTAIVSSEVMSNARVNTPASVVMPLHPHTLPAAPPFPLVTHDYGTPPHLCKVSL